MSYIYTDGPFNSVLVIGFKTRAMTFACMEVKDRMNAHNYIKGKARDYVFTQRLDNCQNCNY